MNLRSKAVREGKLTEPVRPAAAGTDAGPVARMAPWRNWVRQPGGKLLGVLVLLLVAVNGVGIWGIVYSGSEARQEIIKDLELQAIAAARSLEAILASTRADFLFLAQSPPIVSFREALDSKDLMERRWRRLDMEATLLLFLTSHPEVAKVTLLRNDQPFLVGGRRDGAPVILPPEESESALKPEAEGCTLAVWPLGNPEVGERIESWISVSQLVSLASPGVKYDLDLQPGLPGPGIIESGEGEGSVIVPVRDPDWSPNVDWAIIWSERRVGLIESVTRLADRYRMTLGVNVLLLVFGAVLGLVSVRQVRRGIALEIENRQQSQIRELERQLAHSERLASVGRLAAGLAHEINNPLEGMANYLFLLEDDIRSGRIESSLEFVGKVREGLRRAAGVTRRALTFADPGQKPNTLVELRQVISETVDFVRGNPLFRQVDMQVVEPEKEVWVVGNPATLSQTLLNLLLNAAEIQGGQGEIEVSLEHADRNAILRVSDRGPGIEKDLLSRVFEPFLSGRGSTGLGLSICKTIIERHDGEIVASNRPGGGAEFRIRIPSVDPDAGTSVGVGK